MKTYLVHSQNMKIIVRARNEKAARNIKYKGISNIRSIKKLTLLDMVGSSCPIILLAYTGEVLCEL